MIVITKHSGEAVLLPCSCADVQDDPQDIRWLKEPGSHFIQEIYPETHKDYLDRVQVFYTDSPGNMSLLISHLTEKDKGIYRCEVFDFDSKIYRDITLQITGRTCGTKHVQLSEYNETQSPSYRFILVAVLLLLLLLGGAIFLYLRHERMINTHTHIHARTHTHIRTHTHTRSHTLEMICDFLQDDVTYTTVVHGRNPKAAQVRINPDDGTEYASVRTT
ncbi:hypothetical protein ACEWY4_013735 [Coilia grayii]|uniref:Ig-like domain-containing protein n=1 Tax=Coilia grayii TaxID=363190 RepID=A0ABD1JX67_9TELE